MDTRCIAEEGQACALPRREQLLQLICVATGVRPCCPASWRVQVMEAKHHFLHRQAQLLRASTEPLTDEDRVRLRRYRLGPTSLGDGSEGNNK
jgi:hypothetical protein